MTRPALQRSCRWSSGLAGIERVNDAAFNQYGTYYDLLYQDKNYAAEADYVAATLRKAAPDLRDFLEFGAGTGRHGRLLAREGFNVVGIESSKAMVGSTQRDNEIKSDAGEGTFSCEIGDIRNFEINMKFDAVIALFHVVSYQTSNHDLLKVFTNAAHHLKPQGLFFFDVWHGTGGASSKTCGAGETNRGRQCSPDSTCRTIPGRRGSYGHRDLYFVC